MGMLEAAAARVAGGATITVRPTGGSMIPLIASRSLVTIAPVDAAKVEVGDIVLAKVAGTVYLHLVSAVNHAAGRVQISNNRGRVNGWTSHARVFGICTSVDGVARPRIATKVRSGAEPA
ncbi:MAG: S26 family signal peptidase [Hamadaea sp.]|nr:S26 family signal peptidase [Hamadaea sp.]NUT04878.1 S26 family signal peptidase [Hamadaea sp.]